MFPPELVPDARGLSRGVTKATAVWKKPHSGSAFAQRPLDNINSRQYQHEIRPLRRALDGWLHELGLQEFGFSVRLVKASELPDNACGASTYDIKASMGEIDVLRSDEYAKLPGCLALTVSRATNSIRRFTR